jgi:hypothetical protein
MSEVIMSESEKGASPSCRYFYIDPLVIAWMMQSFGMKFDHPTDADWDRLVPRLAENCEQMMGDYPGIKIVMIPYRPGQKWYIHPDSLHLLEPQVGDLITCDQYYDAITIIDPDKPRISWDT